MKQLQSVGMARRALLDVTFGVLLGAPLLVGCGPTAPSGNADSAVPRDASTIPDAAARDAGGPGIDASGRDASLRDAASPDAGQTGVQPMPVPPFPTGEQTVYAPFVGVRIVHRTTDQPRPLSYFVVLVKPDAPGIDFRLTPSNGADPRETTRQTTSEFLADTGAQLGINAHFFTPWPPVDDYAEISGIGISGGQAYSPFDDTFDVGIAFEPDNTPVLVHPADPGNPSTDLSPAVTADEAVGAREQIVTSGVNTATWTALHPRTTLGIAANGEIVIGVVDGRQDGRSEGVGTDEIADVLITDFGVVDAINLDGGGSTTLAIADPAVRLLNIAGGDGTEMTQRRVGSNLVLFAERPAPSATPEDLVAYEPFDHAERPWGTDADPTPLGGGLSNLGGGVGWASAWVDDFSRSRFLGIAHYPQDATGGRPSALAYMDSSNRVLETAGGQARICYGTDCAAKRPIDLNRVGADWLTPALQIGADGAEVWLSFLAQSETGDAGTRWAYLELGGALRLGRISDGGGTWGVEDARSTTQTMSSVPASQPVLFVARIRFLAGPDHVDAWIDPPLDAAPPATPDVAFDLPDFTFRWMRLAGRYSTDFDELRLGRSFAAVTPHL